MTKGFLFLILSISILSLTGCNYVKLSTYTHPRVDLDMEGNKGYISGSGPASSSTLNRPDRKVLQLEVTIPTLGEDVNSAQTTEVKPRRTISEPVYQPQSTPAEKKSAPKIK